MIRLSILFVVIGMISAILGYTMTAKLVLIMGMILMIAGIILSLSVIITRGKKDPSKRDTS
ncbi:MAG: hypothetical protein P1V20_19390 [Verrucomicrobiales bacterium]|nr:hypothetical protein [Verrucomicrobiales bacterium]